MREDKPNRTQPNASASASTSPAAVSTASVACGGGAVEWARRRTYSLRTYPVAGDDATSIGGGGWTTSTDWTRTRRLDGYRHLDQPRLYVRACAYTATDWTGVGRGGRETKRSRGGGGGRRTPTYDQSFLARLGSGASGLAWRPMIISLSATFDRSTYKKGSFFLLSAVHTGGPLERCVG